MTDPLSEIALLLQPKAPYSKVISAAGRWRVHRQEPEQTFYCVLLEGSCRLAADGGYSVILQSGDFALLPSADDFTMSSLMLPRSSTSPVHLSNGEFRLGPVDAKPEMRAIIGYSEFGATDAGLLVSLLPRLLHVPNHQRLATLVKLLADETRNERPAREAVVARLLEVLFLEALRTSTGSTEGRGIARGLADVRLAAAIRLMHEAPARPWTVGQLAREAALSRSSFFDRFSRTVGVAPMEYLLAWRMALAKKLLRDDALTVADVAERVGYRSASTFSVAFTRHAGLPPARYARTAARSAKSVFPTSSNATTANGT